MEKPPPPSDEYATPVEVIEAMAALAKADEARLWNAALRLTRDMRRRDGADCHRALYHEVARLILGGNRRWPKQRVPFPKFYYMTMRNVAGKWRKRYEARREAGIVLVCEATRVGRDGSVWNEAENASRDDVRPEDDLYFRRVVSALRSAVDGHAVRERALEWMFTERDAMTLEGVSLESDIPLAALKAAVTWIRREFTKLRAAEVAHG